MLVKDQKTIVKWNPANKKWYENKGYIFTKAGDNFEVKVEDLTKSAKNKIFVECDYCHNIFQTSYVSYYNSVHNGGKAACIHCGQKKKNDLNKEERAVNYLNRLTIICNDNNYVLLTTLDELIYRKNNYIEIICPKHGYQKASFRNFLRKKDAQSVEKNTKEHIFTIKGLQMN